MSPVCTLRIIILALALLRYCNSSTNSVPWTDIDNVIKDSGCEEMLEAQKKLLESLPKDDGDESSPERNLNRLSQISDDAKQGTYLAELYECIFKKLVESTDISMKDIENDGTIKEGITRRIFDRYGYLIFEMERDEQDTEGAEGKRRKRQAEGVVRVLEEMICDPAMGYDCSKDADSKYRRITGICNNRNNPKWGAHGATEPRYQRNGLKMDPVFFDVSEPRKSVNGGDLKSARSISNTLFKFEDGESETDEENSNTLTAFNWGQFLDHDMVLTPVHGGEGNNLDCCNETTKDFRTICLPIEIPEDDEIFTEKSCMHFVRSSPAPQVDSCDVGLRQVLNELTSFIDGSAVYGSTDEKARDLRNLTDGLLDISLGNKNKTLLPHEEPGKGLCEARGKCSRAGDIRVDVQPGLAQIHLLFVREHNRIAKKLKKFNPDWTDDRLFEETRKIIGAIIQHITYKEYLLNVLNKDTREAYGLKLLNNGFYTGYDENMNPTIRNAFAAAAYRFGHSMIPHSLAFLNNKLVTKRTTRLENLFLDPDFLNTKGGNRVDDFARYAITFPSRKVDRFFEGSIRNKLFESDQPGFDLTALNIQRGRDHGLPPYVKWREYCNLAVPSDFSQLGVDYHDDESIAKLREAYSDVRDIDLYAGAMTEKRLPGSYVGPTFSCLIAEQFQALRKGDRYWYEREGPEGFHEDQLAEIRKVTLAKVMCNNLNIQRAQPNVFRPNSTENAVIKCKELPGMSLRPWKE